MNCRHFASDRCFFYENHRFIGSCNLYPLYFAVKGTSTWECKFLDNYDLFRSVNLQIVCEDHVPCETVSINDEKLHVFVKLKIKHENCNLVNFSCESFSTFEKKNFSAPSNLSLDKQDYHRKNTKNKQRENTTGRRDFLHTKSLVSLLLIFWEQLQG